MYDKQEGLLVMSGSINGLFGKLFDKGKFQEISKLYSNLNKSFNERFYLEIQRHNDHNEKAFEKFNLNQSCNLKIPLIATNEVIIRATTIDNDGKPASSSAEGSGIPVSVFSSSSSVPTYIVGPYQSDRPP